MPKIFKEIRLPGLAILTVLLLVGCGAASSEHFDTINYTEDYLELHRDFLKFSLGDFAVVSEGTRRYEAGSDDPSRARGTFITWALRYQRDTGDEVYFSFNNCPNNFVSSIFSHAAEIGIEYIHRDVVSNYFSQEEMDGGQRTHVSVGWRRTPIDHDIDVENGMRLRYVTTQDLVAYWGITYRISVFTDDYENYLDEIKRLKEVARVLSEYLGQEYVEISFILRDSDRLFDMDRSFWGYYGGLLSELVEQCL